MMRARFMRAHACAHADRLRADQRRRRRSSHSSSLVPTWRRMPIGRHCRARPQLRTEGHCCAEWIARQRCAALERSPRPMDEIKGRERRSLSVGEPSSAARGGCAGSVVPCSSRRMHTRGCGPARGTAPRCTLTHKQTRRNPTDGCVATDSASAHAQRRSRPSIGDKLGGPTDTGDGRSAEMAVGEGKGSRQMAVGL